MTTITETWVGEQLAPTQPSLHLRLIPARGPYFALKCTIAFRQRVFDPRYLQYKVPSLDELAAVCELSPERGAAFVATVKSGKERLVGLAYYMIDQPERAHCRVGHSGGRPVQGQGIGRALWQRLHQHARGEQIHGLRLSCSILSTGACCVCSEAVAIPTMPAAKATLIISWCSSINNRNLHEFSRCWKSLVRQF